jgi:hypothetical protein
VEAFAKAQAALDGRKNGGANEVSETSTWILRDVARCAKCDAKMTSAYAGPHEQRRHYYRCSHRCGGATTRATNGTYLPVHTVEADAEPMILERLEELREELAREPKRPPHRPPAAANFAQRRAKVQRRRERYLEAYADEHMTREELRAAMAKLDASILQIDGEEHAANRPSPLNEPKARRAVLREVGAIRKAWGRATPEAKRKIVGHLAESALLVAGKPCAFVWRSAEELAT